MSDAVVLGAAQIAQKVKAKIVVLASQDGHTALVKSKQRDFIPTIAVTDQRQVVNQMCLYWGITPLFMASIDPESLHQQLQVWAEQSDDLSTGDRVVLVLDTAAWPGVNETVIVTQIGDPS